MKSSFFSRPDPLEAYGYYKKAAECYKSLCKPREEALMWETAGGCSMTLEVRQEGRMAGRQAERGAEVL